MKRILVVNPAAESGGALAILNSFYKSVVEDDNPKIQWTFIVSKADLKATQNVRVLKFEWVKKSKIHRLFFDYSIVGRLIKKYKIDTVFSLQNLAVHTNKPQIVYLHQSIPFADYKFTFGNDRQLWFIQNIMKFPICRSARKAKKMIVQSKWMQERCAKTAKIAKEKILVVPPKAQKMGQGKYLFAGKSNNVFIYPAIAREYKNHRIILDACERLCLEGIDDFEVVFTIHNDENDYAKNLFDTVKDKKIPIRFKGQLDRAELYDMYLNSILLFPSFLETVGLPLKESKSLGGLILAADCPYAHESLGNYPNAHFFDANDTDRLATLMKQCIENEMVYTDVSDDLQNEPDPWAQVLTELVEL